MTDFSSKSPDIQTVLSLLSQRDGLALVLNGEPRIGESQQAYRVSDRGGRNFILKLAMEATVRDAAHTAARLREIGYPAPAYLNVGPIGGTRGYALIEELPGTPPRRFNRRVTDQLLTLIDAQAGQAVLPAAPRFIINTLLFGAPGYALHETMRAYSTTTSELLDEIVAIGYRYFELDFPCDDIVHFDLSPGNVLVHQGMLSGVVDWEGTCSGDRAFDVATLLFYANDRPSIEQKLWQVLLEMAGVERASVYLAHLMLRQVEWSARYDWPPTVQMYLRRSNRLLSSLRDFCQGSADRLP